MAFQINNNTKVELRNSGEVAAISSIVAVAATGGNDIRLINVNNWIYRVHTFTSSGILTVTSAPNNVATVDYLVAAGGGGGSPTGGGGGAGGVLVGTLDLMVGTYTVTVGTGGAASTRGQTSSISIPSTSLIVLNALGGGAGAGPSFASSGGGNVPAGAAGIALTQPSQGYTGGAAGPAIGGGGGGAGGTGFPGAPGPTTAGNGGNGLQSSIAGSPAFYGGGGGGSGGSYGFGGSLIGGNAPAGAGLNGTGSGGAGGGGAGGSGIVIIRYRLT